MRRLFGFFLGMIVGAGLVLFSFKYHVVYTNDGLVLVPKKQAALGDLYADVRNWKPIDWQAHPELVRSLVAHGRGDVIGSSATDSLRDMLRRFNNAEKIDNETQLD